MIGIFDSGIGGLTIVKEIFKLLPQYQIVYFGDLARSPYGTKSAKAIVRFARQITQFLINKGAKIIVIACNTASAEAKDILRKEFKLPTFDVIEPAVREAIKISKNKKIGVIGTRRTIESQAYEKALKALDSDIKLYSKTCPLFVPLVEEGFIKRVETKRIARLYLKEFKNYQIDTLILGCTHYPLLGKVISDVLGKKVKLVDSRKVADSIVEKIKKDQKLKNILKKSKNHQFYFSDLPNNFEAIAQKFLGQKITNIHEVDLDELKVG